MFERLAVVRHFLHTRVCLDFRDRDRLLAWQRRRLKHFLQHQLPRAAWYRPWAGRPLAELPVVDKQQMLEHFSGMNTLGIELQAALDIGLRAEHSRDFSPRLQGVSVGLSSGTSGQRGVFMATDDERALWAGTLLARALAPDLLRQMLALWRAPVRLAFFLRANSNVYTTLGSRRLHFRFYDLVAGLAGALDPLQQQQPHILVAPASVLVWLARCQLAGQLQLTPRQVLSVAEVLEPDDAQVVQRAFGVVVQQIYQATEGFLAYSCELGTLHLNEANVLFEEEWLDVGHTRFVPIITDFTRRTQLVVRYRLNDVLQLAATPCACGRAERALAAVEGRCDDILWLNGPDGAPRPLFPDVVRRALLLAATGADDWAVHQQDDGLHVQLQGENDAQLHDAVRAALRELCQAQGVVLPPVLFDAWQDRPVATKRRRIRGYGLPPAEGDKACRVY